MKNKRIVILLLVFNMLITSVFAAQIPEWLKAPESNYPHDEFIQAIGEGSSEKKAQSNAVSQIALQFNTKVRVINTAISDLQTSTENDRTKFFQKDQLHQNLSSISEAEFYCLQFTNTYYDKKQKKYYVLAYIKRSEAFDVYQSKIKPLIEEIQFLIDYAEQENEPLYKLFLYHRASIYGEIAKAYISNAVTIYPKKSESLNSKLSLIAVSNTLGMEHTNRISFSVTCDNPRAKNLIQGISSILEENGFIYTDTDPIYKIKISISFSEEVYEAGEFVRPSISIIVTNRENSTIESYSKVYPRYTHGTIENSYSLAILRIQTDLEENFLSAYRFINIDE